MLKEEWMTKISTLESLQHYSSNMFIQSNVFTSVQCRHDSLKAVHYIVKRTGAKQKEQSKKYYDQDTKEVLFNIGDQVLGLQPMMQGKLKAR